MPRSLWHSGWVSGVVMAGNGEVLGHLTPPLEQIIFYVL